MNPQSKRNQNAWDSEPHERGPLWLLTPREFEDLPDGTVLEGIFGNTAVKGLDYIDDDTRFGVLAYGIRDKDLP